MKNNSRSLIHNRKASHSYFIFDKYEAGVALKGAEVKSIRSARANLSDAYVKITNNEAYVMNMHISPYDAASDAKYEPKRGRKLLLHKNEIIKLSHHTSRKGHTIVPLRVYLKKGKVKIEIALCKGKQQFDKRESIKKKMQEREMDRALKR